MSRKYTSRLLELVEDGSVDKDIVIQACLEYLSEVDVKDMMINNDFPIDADVKDFEDFNADIDDSDFDADIDEDNRYYD